MPTGSSIFASADRIVVLRRLKHLDGFVRRVHGNDRRRRHPVSKGSKCLGTVRIERTTARQARFIVMDAGDTQAAGWVHHSEIDPNLVQAFVEKLRHHGRGPVARVAGRRTPERLLRHILAPPLSYGHAE